MLLKLSGCWICTQTANIRLANSSGLVTEIKDAEVQTQRSGKCAGARGDTAHQNQAMGLDFGPPGLQVPGPSPKVWR